MKDVQCSMFDKNKSPQQSKPLITTTAVIDTTLPPIDKWQGRKEEINELQTALNNDNIRLIGITAAGGYGKTALAVKITEQLGVFWVNFNQPYPLAQFGRWLLEKLNQPYDEKWDEETLILQLIQGLIAEPCLLVLNNLETVLTAENDSVYGQFLSQWLSKGSKSKVLLTSREQPKFSTNLQKRCHWQGLKGLKPLDYYQDYLPAPPWENLEDVTAYLEAFYHAGELGNWQLAYDILNEERGGEGKDKSVNLFLHFQGFYRQRVDLYEQVIVHSQREEDCYRNSLHLLGLCYQLLGRYEEAIAHHQQHYNINEEMGNRQEMAISLGNLGNSYYLLGQYEAAINYHQQSLQIEEEMSNREGVAMSLGNLGSCYYYLGQYETAIHYYQNHHDFSREIGHQQGLAIALGNLGNCYRSLGLS